MSRFRLQLLLAGFFVAGLLLRIVLLNNSVVSKILGNRIEISTSLSKWKRAVEGVSLSNEGINPYDGDIFHESPVALVLYRSILSQAPESISFIFAACDLLTAGMLALAASIYTKDLVKRERKDKNYSSSASSVLVNLDQTHLIPCFVASVYLFCPYAIATCVGKSTVVFLNMLIALFILLTSVGTWAMAGIILGIISYHSFYHVSLLVPLVMYIDQKWNTGKNRTLHICRLCATVFVVLLTIFSLLMLSRYLTESWHFLSATYGCILSVPDLTPNIGLFWYFFTEMFEHFRVFFLWTFQLNAFIYTAPLAIRLRREPMLLLFVHLIIIAIFKSYPSIGDIALYLSFLPVWSHLFLFMRQSFLVGCILVSCTFLSPTLWHLWIYTGSANANFYFAITLAFNTGQIFLLTDILSAYIKREYYLLNGIKTAEDGTLLLLRLQ